MPHRGRTKLVWPFRGRVLTRILIAGDHSLMRTTLKALLETHADWHVSAEAASGAEAVRKAAELKPDLIVLDFAMPEMDGLQAAREIFSASPELPILIYTACAFTPEAKLEARKIGVRDVINKEASLDQLISVVEALLIQRRRGAADATAADVDLPATDLPCGPLPT